MDALIPVFPLSLVVFPGETLNLHIFEPRYKALVHDCISQNKSFGVPSYINGKMMEFGTEVEVVNIDRVYAKGEMDIVTRGLRIFHIEEFEATLPQKPYGGARVNWVKPDFNGDLDLSREIVVYLRKLHQILKIKKDKIGRADDFLTYDVAHLVGFTIEQEYQLLKTMYEQDRQQMMLEHLKKILPIARQTEALKDRVKANGHFKNILPPK